jgi:hypothetical protein
MPQIISPQIYAHTMSIAGWHWNRIGKLAYLAINDFVAFVDV